MVYREGDVESRVSALESKMKGVEGNLNPGFRRWIGALPNIMMAGVVAGILLVGFGSVVGKCKANAILNDRKAAESRRHIRDVDSRTCAGIGGSYVKRMRSAKPYSVICATQGYLSQVNIYSGRVEVIRQDRKNNQEL